MKERSTVLVPIVRHGGAEAESYLLPVYAEAVAAKQDVQALEKDWDPVAATLRPAGLYASGLAAVSAVRKLAPPAPRRAFYQHLRPGVWLDRLRLRCGPVPASGHIEGESAELALALALLLEVAGISGLAVVATGTFTGGLASAHDASDSAVHPVAHLREKLRAVAEGVRRGQASADGDGSRLVALIPRTCLEGSPPVPSDALPELAKLEALGVRVEPVGSLGEAARCLGIRHRAVLRADRAVHAVLAAVAMLALGGAGWHAWTSAPLPVEFVSPDPALPRAEPYEACYGGTGLPWAAIERDGLSPLVPADGTLGWNVRVGNADGLPGRVCALLGCRGYHVALLLIGERTGARAIVPRELRLAPGAIWKEWGWELDGTVESSALVLLASRHSPFDDEALERVAAGGEGARAPFDVTSAVSRLRRAAPGAAHFVFRAVEETGACARAPRAARAGPGS